MLLPIGPKIAFTGGLDVNDHAVIWDTLDKVHAKHPDMVLLHGGSPKGAERIAACWADNREVTQIVFKPDWNRHARAAPFKRNDRILGIFPIGVIVLARASRPTWPTRRRSLASPSGSTAARERCRTPCNSADT